MARKPRQDAAKRAPVTAVPSPLEPPRNDAQIEAMNLLRAGKLNEAGEILEAVVASDPQNWQALHLLGLILYRQHHHVRAAALIRQCLAINPTLAEAYSDLGVVFKDLGELDDAQAACERAIALKPGFHPAHSNLGNIFKALGRFEDAADCYIRAIELAPNFADGYANLGSVLLTLRKPEDALKVCRRAVELAPHNVPALVTLGHALRAIEEPREAIRIYRRAIELKPDYGPAHSDLGCALQEAGQIDEAMREHKRALELQPDSAEVHNNYGITLKALGRHAEALSALKTAVALRPKYAEAHSNMGVVLGTLGEFREAVAAYRRAIEADPKLLFAYINLAGTLWEQSQLGEAIAIYSKALTIDPDQPAALLDHYHLRRHACDWDGIAAAEQKILTSSYRKGKPVAPFAILNIPCGPEEHLLSARQWAKSLLRVRSAPFTHAPMRSAAGGKRLRIGYLSADFCGHATASLIAELIESHDRERFEIFGYCFSADDDSAMRRRLVAAFDDFIPINALSHADAAKRIHQDSIDILIDLKGYTNNARTEILACRPAPIQVNYLGYPGPMGADFIDYVIADDFILPMDQQPFYDEKIVHLPGCYQPNDTQRPIAPDFPSRAECGLPETGVVFACFNNSYKITPDVFACWMRTLQAVPGSVLWLLEANALVRENLQRKAVASGVDPARLIFAPKMNLPEHLARHSNADLFLDTLPVNAHTTASDALWAGLPVLTCAGESFVARVCGSLLKAVGLDELITYSLEQYEHTAIVLARNPDSLAALRRRLINSKATAPLFDIARYKTGLEAALEHMAELRERGQSPRSFSVSPIGGELPASFPDLPTAPVLSAAPAYAPPPEPAERVQVRIAYEACPLCSSQDIPVFKEADCSGRSEYDSGLPPTVRWCRCGDCGHVFTQGYFSPEASKIIFAKTPPDQAVGYDLEAQRLLSARIVGQIAKLRPGGAWLDVEFGNAALLFTAAEWGYQPVGIDPRRDNIEALSRLGYETYGVPVQELDAPGRFSVVSLTDVLQHMPFPRETLTAVHRLLKPGGVLYLSMPNMETIIWKAMDIAQNNPFWSELEHYHNFTRERLYKLLDEHSFRPTTYNVSDRYPSCMDVIATKF
jgi:predicted O-linked N-acetylglucosamine transferase (SPINDLY family)/SAM-dependent methyltransferase